MQKYTCEICSWVYDPAKGEPEQGIKPGTPFDQLPEDFHCPLCGSSKEEFSPEQE